MLLFPSSSCPPTCCAAGSTQLYPPAVECGAHCCRAANAGRMRRSGTPTILGARPSACSARQEATQCGPEGQVCPLITPPSHVRQQQKRENSTGTNSY
eukprot:349881-Chlamydomonas_euryale.AAC.3